MRRERTSIALPIILLVSLLSALQAPTEVAAAGIPDPRFGVVEAFQAPNAATTLGAGWTRVTFRWNEIQPNGPGEWHTVPISDEALARELAQGRQVVGLLVTTPGWATDLDIGPGVPRGLHLPTDHPENLWATFVRTIVARYAGRIDHWIIWNEPDIPETQHMSWGGSTEDFVRLLQVGYTVAKETNPGAVVHLAAVTHWWDEDWFGRFLDKLMADPAAAANNYYFDVATLHIYFQPETVYQIAAHYRDMMWGRGIRKPIWIAETNAAPSQDPAWPVPNAQFSVSLEQQAAYIVQAFSLAIAAGAERVAVYKMADTETDRQANPEPFGLVRMDGSRRPAFTAFQVASTYMAGFSGGRWERRDAVSVVTIDRGDRTTTVVWARTAQAEMAMIAARTTQALLVDVQGRARTIYAERGYYYVDLPGATCVQGCKIGGPPYMLVEQAPASADTAPTPRSPTPTALETATAEGTSASGATSTATTGSAIAPELSEAEQTSTASATPTPTLRAPQPSEPPEGADAAPARVTPTPTAGAGNQLEPSEGQETPTATATPMPTPQAKIQPEISEEEEQETPTVLATATPRAGSRIRPELWEGEAASDRSWVLIGILVLSLAGVALATGIGKI